jgi:hypothetical protein
VFNPVSAQPQTTTECIIPGDPDVLGLGVRIGFYLQLLSNLVLGTIRPQDASKGFLQNVFFIICLVTAAIFSSAKHQFPAGSTIACTWYPVLAYVAIIPFLFCLLPKSLPTPQVILSAAVGAVTSCFAIWFWYKGLDQRHPAQCMEPRVFLFFNCSAMGDVRTVFKVLTPLLLALSILSGSSIPVFHMIYLSSCLGDDLERPESPRRVRVFILGFLWLTLGIVAFELQLKWNHVDGINAFETTGQLIPLTFGSLSVLQTICAFVGPHLRINWSRNRNGRRWGIPLSNLPVLKAINSV